MGFFDDIRDSVSSAVSNVSNAVNQTVSDISNSVNREGTNLQESITRSDIGKTTEEIARSDIGKVGGQALRPFNSMVRSYEDVMRGDFGGGARRITGEYFNTNPLVFLSQTSDDVKNYFNQDNSKMGYGKDIYRIDELSDRWTSGGPEKETDRAVIGSYGIKTAAIAGAAYGAGEAYGAYSAGNYATAAGYAGASQKLLDGDFSGGAKALGVPSYISDYLPGDMFDGGPARGPASNYFPDSGATYGYQSPEEFNLSPILLVGLAVGAYFLFKRKR